MLSSVVSMQKIPLRIFVLLQGRLPTLHIPGGHGVRIDSHIYSGYSIPPHYDSMVAKLIVSAPTREEAIIRMKRALQEFVIEGVKTTIPLTYQVDG